MNEEEDRRRHDKAWNDPPMFSYDQLNQQPPHNVPLNRRYKYPPADPNQMYGYQEQGSAAGFQYQQQQLAHLQQIHQQQLQHQQQQLNNQAYAAAAYAAAGQQAYAGYASSPAVSAAGGYAPQMGYDYNQGSVQYSSPPATSTAAAAAAAAYANAYNAYAGGQYQFPPGSQVPISQSMIQPGQPPVSTGQTVSSQYANPPPTSLAYTNAPPRMMSSGNYSAQAQPAQQPNAAAAAAAQYGNAPGYAQPNAGYYNQG